MLVYKIKVINDLMLPIEIRYGNKLLAKYNKETKRIDFSVLYPFVRKEIQIQYYNKRNMLINKKNFFIENISTQNNLGIVLNLKEIKEE